MHVSKIQGKAGGWRQGQDLGLWQHNRVCCSFWQWVTRAPGCTGLLVYLSPFLPPHQQEEEKRGATLSLTCSPFRPPSSEDSGILRPALEEAEAAGTTQQHHRAEQSSIPHLHAPEHNPLSLHINWKDTFAFWKQSWRHRSPSSSPAFTR